MAYLLGFLIGCFPFLLFGAILIVRSRRKWKRAIASASWPQVTGTVTSTSVTAEEITGGEYTTGRTVYRPNVAYAYEVAGQPHTGRCLAFGVDTRDTYEAAQALLAPYPAGATIPVFYDPADPRSATLSTDLAGVRTGEITGWVVCALALPTLYFLGQAALQGTGTEAATASGGLTKLEAAHRVMAADEPCRAAYARVIELRDAGATQAADAREAARSGEPACRTATTQLAAIKALALPADDADGRTEHAAIDACSALSRTRADLMNQFAASSPDDRAIAALGDELDRTDTACQQSFARLGD